MATTRVYIDSTVSATRSLGQITFPITALSTVISDMILQWDVDATGAASLSRNRVGSPMTVVGAPVISGYSVALNESNYIDSGLPMQNYNASDLTFVSISKNPGGQFNIVGLLQVAAPQRSRSHLYTTATNLGARWLNSSGTALVATLGATPLAAASSGVDGITAVARSYINNGAGSIGLRIDFPRTGANASVSGSAEAPTTITGNIRIGSSIDAATTVTGSVYAVLVFNRAITASEMATIYNAYKKHYADVGVLI